MPDRFAFEEDEVRTKGVDTIARSETFSTCLTCPGPQRTPTVHAEYCMPVDSAQDYHTSGVDKSREKRYPAHKGRRYICKVCGIELSSVQSLGGHLNEHKAEGVPSVTARLGGSDATSAFNWIIGDAVVRGSATSDNDVGCSEQVVSFQLQSKDLPSKRLLGKGLAGYGYETTWKGERFARKDFIRVPRSIFEKEAAFLIGLEDHKNIVKTYGWTADKRSCSLVLEYMDDDLLSLLEKRSESTQGLTDLGCSSHPSTSTIKEPFDLRQAIDMMLQIAAGMKALHEKGIAHGDLKTKNILVTYGYKRDQNLMAVKVADFGLVCSKRKSKFIVSHQVHKLDMVQWKAPEYLEVQLGKYNLSCDRDGAYLESDSSSESESELEVTSTPSVVNVRLPGVDVFAADVFSFALICSQILTGSDPYPNLNWKELGFKILSGLRPNLPSACQPLLRDLLESCWRDPAQRPTFSTIHMRLEHLHAALLIKARAARRIQKAFRSCNVKKQELAASRIQQKFRSWKVRKDFLNLRHRIVRIQAHVRRNLVRRRFRKFRWSVGVLEKATLRWKRERSGRQGFKSGDISVNTEEDKFMDELGKRIFEEVQYTPFVSSDRGGCKPAMRRVIPMFSSKTDHIMSRYRPIAPKPTPKFEVVGFDSQSTLSSLSTNKLSTKSAERKGKQRKERSQELVPWNHPSGAWIRSGSMSYLGLDVESVELEPANVTLTPIFRDRVAPLFGHRCRGTFDHSQNDDFVPLSLYLKSPPQESPYGAPISLKNTLCSEDGYSFSIGKSHDGLENDSELVDRPALQAPSLFSMEYSNTCLMREPCSGYPSASTCFGTESTVCSPEDATDSRKADIITLSLLPDTPCSANTRSNSSSSTLSLLRSDIRWSSDKEATSNSDLYTRLTSSSTTRWPEGDDIGWSSDKQATSNSDLYTSLTLSSTTRWPEGEAIGDHCVPENFCRANPFLDRVAGISQGDVEGQVVDAHYLEQRHGGSLEAIMLTDELDTVLWVNSAFKRLFTERITNRVQAVGPGYFDPLGIRTHLATLTFQPPFPAWKCHARLWGFLKKFILLEGDTHKPSDLSEGQRKDQDPAQAKVLAQLETPGSN